MRFPTELKKYNYEIFLIVFLALAFFAPLIAFTYIVYSDQDLTLFQKLLNLDFQHNLIMSNYLTKNIVLIKTITLCGVIFFTLGIFSLLSKILINQKMLKLPKLHRKLIIASSVTTGVFYVMAFILLGIAQADFSYFNRWVTSLQNPNHINNVLYNLHLQNIPNLQNILAQISNNHNGANGPTYNWISSVGVWLLASLILAVQLFMLLKITFSILYERESWFLKRIRFWNTKNPKRPKWSQFFTITSLRQAAYYFLLGNLCLLLIFVIYYIFLVDKGSLSRFIDFVTIQRTLFPLSNGSTTVFYNNLYLKWITIKEISIFFVFLQILLSFFFFYTNIARSQINIKTYYIWFSLWSFLEIITIAIFTYSALQINDLFHNWQANKSKFPPFHFTSNNNLIANNKIIATTIILVTYVIVKLAVIIRSMQNPISQSKTLPTFKNKTASLTSKIS